jgi:hypothetical protein
MYFQKLSKNFSSGVFSGVSTLQVFSIIFSEVSSCFGSSLIVSSICEMYSLFENSSLFSEK